MNSDNRKLQLSSCVSVGQTNHFPVLHTDFIKAVVPFANFENANLSDVLMDRAVLNEANLKNANLQRTVLTR